MLVARRSSASSLLALNSFMISFTSASCALGGAAAFAEAGSAAETIPRLKGSLAFASTSFATSAVLAATELAGSSDGTAAGRMGFSWGWVDALGATAAVLVEALCMASSAADVCARFCRAADEARARALSSSSSARSAASSPKKPATHATGSAGCSMSTACKANVNAASSVGMCSDAYANPLDSGWAWATVVFMREHHMLRCGRLASTTFLCCAFFHTNCSKSASSTHTERERNTEGAHLGRCSYKRTVRRLELYVHVISTRSQTDTPVHTGRHSGQTAVKQTQIQILKKTHVRPTYVRLQ